MQPKVKKELYERLYPEVDNLTFFKQLDPEIKYDFIHWLYKKLETVTFEQGDKMRIAENKELLFITEGSFDFVLFKNTVEQVSYFHLQEGAITGFEDIIMSFEPLQLSMLVNRQQSISDLSHHLILEGEKLIERTIDHSDVSGLKLNLKKNFKLWQTKFPDVANDFFDFQLHQSRHILFSKLTASAKVLGIKDEVPKPCDEQDEA